MAMRVLVCGSREWTDAYAIRCLLLSLPPDTTVIHGAATGADQIAGQIARSLGLAVEEFPADWSKHGRRAGAIRNKAMIATKPDLVLAFQLHRSRGTEMTIKMAKQAGIPVQVTRAT